MTVKQNVKFARPQGEKKVMSFKTKKEIMLESLLVMKPPTVMLLGFSFFLQQ